MFEDGGGGEVDYFRGERRPDAWLWGGSTPATQYAERFYLVNPILREGGASDDLIKELIAYCSMLLQFRKIRCQLSKLS